MRKGEVKFVFKGGGRVQKYQPHGEAKKNCFEEEVGVLRGKLLLNSDSDVRDYSQAVPFTQRHARPCAGHPYLKGNSAKQDVDGRDIGVL
jgi:hypothetical protein